jgi:hypothetical protein
MYTYVLVNGWINISNVCTACYPNVEICNKQHPACTLLSFDIRIPAQDSRYLAVRRVKVTLDVRWGIICVLVGQSRNQKSSYNHCYWVTNTGCYRSLWRLFIVLQFPNLTVVKQLRFVYKNQKRNSSSSSHFCHYVSEFKGVLTSDGKVLFCQACGQSIAMQQYSQVTQHTSASKHIAFVVGLKFGLAGNL